MPAAFEKWRASRRGEGAKEAGPQRRPFTSRGLLREFSYFHSDEAEALASRAQERRLSKSEVMRWALRRYLGIED